MEGGRRQPPKNWGRGSQLPSATFSSALPSGTGSAGWGPVCGFCVFHGQGHFPPKPAFSRRRMQVDARVVAASLKTQCLSSLGFP